MRRSVEGCETYQHRDLQRKACENRKNNRAGTTKYDLTWAETTSIKHIGNLNIHT